MILYMSVFLAWVVIARIVWWLDLDRENSLAVGIVSNSLIEIKLKSGDSVFLEAKYLSWKYAANGALEWKMVGDRTQLNRMQGINVFEVAAVVVRRSVLRFGVGWYKTRPSR